MFLKSLPIFPNIEIAPQFTNRATVSDFFNIDQKLISTLVSNQ